MMKKIFWCCGDMQVYQYVTCDKSRTGFVLTFYNCLLLWVSNIHTDINLSTLHYEYVELSHSVRDSLPLKSLINKVVGNLVKNS